MVASLQHPTDVVSVIRRLAALTSVLTLCVGNVAVCAGWQATPEARMACCMNDTSCPMHKSESHHHGSNHHVTQTQADSCCAGSERNDSATSQTTFVSSGTVALVVAHCPGGGSADRARAPRVARPRATTRLTRPEAPPALRPARLAKTVVVCLPGCVSGLVVAYVYACAAGRVSQHDQSTHRAVASQSLHRHRAVRRRSPAGAGGRSARRRSTRFPICRTTR